MEPNIYRIYYTKHSKRHCFDLEGNDNLIQEAIVALIEEGAEDIQVVDRSQLEVPPESTPDGSWVINAEAVLTPEDFGITQEEHWFITERDAYRVHLDGSQVQVTSPGGETCFSLQFPESVEGGGASMDLSSMVEQALEAYEAGIQAGRAESEASMKEAVQQARTLLNRHL